MNTLENVIVYQSALLETSELVEYFHNLGYEPLLVDKRSTLLSACSQGNHEKVFIEVCNLSDIRLINAIRQVYNDVDIVLIVKPGLEDIIDVLQNNQYQIVNSIMNLSNVDPNQ